MGQPAAKAASPPAFDLTVAARAFAASQENASQSWQRQE